MNLKYMMLKKRYKFIYNRRLSVFSEEDNIRRGREASFFIKELALYGTNLNALSKLKPSAHVKDELLNLAFICIEEHVIFETIKNTHELPIKAICNYTDKSKGYIEKWQQYILAYVILFSNKDYTYLSSYLTIQKKNPSNIVISEQNTGIDVINPSPSLKGTTIGVVLRSGKYFCYVLTPFGDFVRLKIKDSSSVNSGYIYSGLRARNFSFYKYPVFTVALCFFILVMLFSYIYLSPKNSILINANSMVRLQLNSFDRVIKVYPMNKNGTKLSRNLSLFNKSVDDTLYLVLKEGKDQDIIKKDTQITIFISGLKNSPPVLSQTENFIYDNNLNAQINNNGQEYTLKKAQGKK